MTIKMYKQATANGLIYFTTADGNPVAKRCSDCGYIRPLTRFSKGADSLGKQTKCSMCGKQYNREHRQTPHGRIIMYENNVKRILDDVEKEFGIRVENNLPRYDIAWIYGSSECSYCGKDLQPHQITIDHVRPPKQGGGNVFKNLLPSCRSCNTRKGTKTLYQFLMEDVVEDQRKHVIFELATKNGLTYKQMKEHLKVARTFNLFEQSWSTIEREGLARLFKNQEDFEKRKAEFIEGGITND